MTVHLYHDSSSRNRKTDTNPRFFLKPVKLHSVEKVGFTKEAKDQGYQSHGNRFWKWKMAWGLTDAKAEEIYEQIKKSYPYGYDADDTASTFKYIEDVKYNQPYQSYYSKYWRNHASRQQTNNLFPYPYIEFDIDEVVSVKHTEDVPTPPEGTALWAEYRTDKSKYTYPQSYSCLDEDVYVYAQEGPKDDPWWYLNGYPKSSLPVVCSGSYNFHLISGLGTTVSWPTGSNNLPSGIAFLFSTGQDGTHNDYDEFTDEVTKFVSPEYHSLWDFSVSSVYYVSGNLERPQLNVTRGSTYLFTQTGATNIGHPLFISNDDVENNPPVFSSGVTYINGDGEGYLEFKVPHEAPNNLYYYCQNHTEMGGSIAVSDPVAAEGNKPGQTVRIKFTGDGTAAMKKKISYYGTGEAGTTLSGMGNDLYLRTECEGSEIFGVR